MATTVDALCDDLLAERAQLFEILDLLAEAQWATPTAARPWSVLDQVVHLAWFDDAARESITDQLAFIAARDEALADVDGFVEVVRQRHEHCGPQHAASWLRRSTVELVAAARAADPSARVPWYGPDMTIASCITARIMETWAHGQDVADAVGAPHEPSDRLRHVAFIAVRALPNSFRAHELDVPQEQVRVELVAPSGELWEFGPPVEKVSNIVRGAALDFCLLATQRCHRADTTLVAIGPVADAWLDVAQAFAGPPGAKRPAGARRAPDEQGGDEP